jgi:hypothetical protein
MSIETDLYATLTGDSTLSVLINSRVYPNLAPEGAARPLVTYQVVSGGREPTIAGTGNAVRKRVQLSCHADLYSTSKTVAAAVIAALEGNGYCELEYDMYDPTVQVYTSIVDWSFMSV